MIFGVVTAEIAKEFSESLRCHDRRKVFENVVSRSGVTLFMSDDKKDIRLQGLWESVKDAYDILEGEYGSYVGLPAKSPSNDGRGRKPQQSRASKISSLAASKTWCSPPSSTEKEKTTPLPKGSVRSAGYRGKSAWKLMKNWPKAPDPVIIFEGVTPGVSSSADLLSKGNKDEIRKAIEDITSKQQQKYDPELSAHAQPTFDSEQHIEPEMSDVGNLLPDFHGEQVNQNAAPPAAQYDRTEVEERATVIETVNDRNGEVDEEDPHEDVADTIEDSDDDDMQNKGETSVPDNIDSDKPHDDSSPVKEDTDVKEEVEAEPEPKPEKVKTGPQTRGNKRKAGRPRKIPIKTVSSGDDGILDDSDSDYKAPPKKSRRKRRAPMRKSQRRRAPVRRQGVVATPDEPVVKRKRGRPRKSEKEVLKCADCDFIAKNKIQLRTHKQRLHVGSETGSCRCPVCDKQFSFEKDMKRHMMRHVDTRYPCDICGRVYKDRKTMLTHKERHKEGWVQPTFSCDQCSKKFCTKYILTNHIKSEHLGLKRLFLCPTCGKSFTQKHAYLQHANVHLGIKPFVCDICSKAFAYEKSLKEHKFMHFDEKTFVCQVCSKAFRQKSALVVHAKIHKTTKDFLCSVCSKGFTQKQALLRHERVHNGEKPFACGVCGRTFSDKSIIRRHMILVHKRDSKQWKENTFEEKKERSDYFVTPKLHCDLVEEPPATTDSATVTQQMPKTILTPLAPQTTPAIPPPMLSLEQREVNHPTPPEPVPISPAPPVPPRMPSVPLSMVPQTQLPPIATHAEENLHPAHSGMPPISHGGPLFNPRDMHELRDIRDMRDMRDMQDMRDIRTPDMRTVDLHVRDLRNAEMRELQPADMRDMRTSDVRDMRVLGPRDHPKMSSLTDLRDVRVPDMRDMRLPDMRDLRPPSHNDLRDLRDLRDLGRDGHLSVPPLPAPGHEPAVVTTHSVAEMSPGSLTSSVSYSTSIPPGISSHHGAYPSTVSSPSPMPVHHYPYMYSNIPQNYDPHSGSPYVQQPQMNYYQ